MNGGPENGHLWFFITLFWCFIIGYVLLKYIGDKSLIAVLLIAILLRETDVSLFPAFMGFSNALTYLVWFVAGYIYEKKVRSRSADTGTGTHAIAFLILTAIMIFFTLFVKSGSS